MAAMASGRADCKRPRGRRCLLTLSALLLLFLVSACSSVQPAVVSLPTPVAAADTPVIHPTNSPDPSQAQATRLAPTVTPTPYEEIGQPTAVQPQSGTIVPVSAGIPPEQARLFRAPQIGVEATVEWRPPPLPVPLSVHPDDHYWLIRPIPSDKRNYDLEWFPYGNDVLLPDLYPYRVHRGLDFPNKEGTPVLAASSGTVIHAGPMPSRIDGLNYYGNTVVVKHDWQWRGQDVYTLYAHTLELFVEVGDYVEQGQLLAGVGRTGIVSGPHLHLEVRIGENTYEHTHNPILWIAPYEGWGTLAGRIIDQESKYIYGAWVSARPLDVDAPTRGQYTYLIREVNPDDVWRENFVIGDLPAGRYEVNIMAAGHQYQHTVEILPGRTNFLSLQTDFVYVPPTPTPTGSPSPEAAPPEDASAALPAETPSP